VEVHQVTARQEVVKQPMAGQCDKAGTIEGIEEALEPDGLLLEGEEQEYFLELLMRRASPERLKASRPTEGRDDLKSEAVAAKGKEKKKNKRKEKKALGKSLAGKEAGGQEKEVRTTGQADGLERQQAPDLASNPEAKGRGLVDSSQEKKEQAMRPQATSGGECSGQKTPDSS
jgi:hypothetical protein